MESIRSLELIVATWYRGVPHLPKGIQRSIAKNVWWLILIAVILGTIWILGCLVIVSFAFLAGYGGVVTGILSKGILYLTTSINLTLAVIEIIVSAIAIAPLRVLQKKGWTLLFVIGLLNMLYVVILFLLTFDFLSLIWELFVVTIEAYFLFEIRDYYILVEHTTKQVAQKI